MSQHRLFAQHDTLPAYQLEHSLRYKAMNRPPLNLSLMPAARLFRFTMDSASFTINIPEGPLSNTHGTAGFMYTLDSVGNVLSLKLLEIQIYSGPDVLDWIIFTGKDHAGKIHQGITFDQLQTANLDEVTRAAVNGMFDREQ